MSPTYEEALDAYAKKLWDGLSWPSGEYVSVEWVDSGMSKEYDSFGSHEFDRPACLRFTYKNTKNNNTYYGSYDYPMTSAELLYNILTQSDES